VNHYDDIAKALGHYDGFSAEFAENIVEHGKTVMFVEDLKKAKKALTFSRSHIHGYVVWTLKQYVQTQGKFAKKARNMLAALAL